MSALWEHLDTIQGGKQFEVSSQEDFPTWTQFLLQAFTSINMTEASKSPPALWTKWQHIWLLNSCKNTTTCFSLEIWSTCFIHVCLSSPSHPSLPWCQRCRAVERVTQGGVRWLRRMMIGPLEVLDQECFRLLERWSFIVKPKHSSHVCWSVVLFLPRTAFIILYSLSPVSGAPACVSHLTSCSCTTCVWLPSCGVKAGCSLGSFCWLSWFSQNLKHWAALCFSLTKLLPEAFTTNRDQLQSFQSCEGVSGSFYRVDRDPKTGP